MDQKDPSFSPSRQATRAPVDLLVRLEAEGKIEAFEARCDNISIGGMFAITEVTGEPGLQMRFELEVAEAGTVRGLVEIVWCQPASDLRPAGIGLKFRYLEQRDRQLIFKLVSRHIKERLASRPTAPTALSPPVGPAPSFLSVEDAPAGPPAFAITGPTAAVSPAPPAPPPMPSMAQDFEPESPFSFQPAPPHLDAAPAVAQQTLDLMPSGSPDPMAPAAISVTETALPAAVPSESTPPVSAASFSPELVTMPAAEPSSTPAPSFDSVPIGSGSDASMSEPLGFADLGGPAKPQLGYQGMAADPAIDGPSVLDESVGDSLFGEGAAPPAPAADSSYSEYLGEDHFEHRPAPKKERPILIVAALILLLVAALAYLFGDRIFDLDGSAAVGPAPVTSAGSEGGPPSTAGAGQMAAQAGAMKSLVGISFAQAGQAAEVIVTASRNFTAGEFDSFRLDGDNPREVVRLFAFERAERPNLAVGHAGVRQVRIGWHEQEGEDPQIHLVIDLEDPRAHIIRLKPEGRRLIISLERRR